MNAQPKKSPAKLAAEFYNKIVYLHHAEFNYQHVHFKKWLDILDSKLNKGDSILDLGCGNGRIVKYYIRKGYRCFGMDVSDKMLRLAKKHVPLGKFVKADITKKLNFKPGSFNAIISFFALNHVSKRQFITTIKNCKNILKRDGFLLLGLVKGNDEGFFKGFYGKNMTLYGAKYSTKELVDILRKNSYYIIKKGCDHFKGKYFEENDIYIMAKI